MNSHQIGLFLDVAKEKNYSRVARERYISQPTITKHIQHLEAELNAKLFERKGSSIELTAAGRIYYDLFSHFREAFEKATFEAGQLARLPKTLRIGLLSGWNVGMDLISAIDRIRDEYAEQLNIIIEHHSFTELRQGLSDGSLDACIHLHDFLFNIEHLEITPLLEIPKYLIYSSRPSIPIPEAPEISDFTGHIFFVVGDQNIDFVSKQLESYCMVNFIVPKQIVKAPNIETVLHYVNRGGGVSIIDGYTGTGDYPDIRRMEIFPSHKISIAWNRNNHNPILDAIAKELADSLTLPSPHGE